MRYVVCDVFTDRPLHGNPLAVFTSGEQVPTELMQPLARELNLSETVFVLPPEAGGDARIRIFTPTSELQFAGHPVLGTAVVLGGERGLSELVLETGAGHVPVRLDPGGTSGRMSQPLPTVEPFRYADALQEALGFRSELPVDVYDNGLAQIYAVLPDQAAVAAHDPDMTAIARFIRDYDLIGTNVSVCAGAGTSFKTRMFAPAEGIPEDPATGSAAGPLAWHAVRYGLAASGDELTISQGVEIGRPSTLLARAVGDRDTVELLEVGGSASVVAEGRFSL
jgi:trans-2,3-dihydro-3-hydroxyanthranilate isomerase